MKMLYNNGDKPNPLEMEEGDLIHNAHDKKTFTRDKWGDLSELELDGGGDTNFKNKIVNATFDVWQEHPSKSVVVGETMVYAADLFRQQARNGQFTTTEGEIDGSRSLKLTINTPPTDLTGVNYWYVFDYKFEGQQLYKIAKEQGSVTFSFKFRATKTGIYSMYFQHHGTDSYISEFTVSTAGVVEKHTVTIPLDHTWTDALHNDENSGFIIGIGFLNVGDYATSTLDQWQNESKFCSANQVNWGDTAGNYIEIAEPQLEEGTVATEFERPDYGTTLRRVQRYYWPVPRKQTINSYVATYARVSNMQYPVEMRVVPSVSESQSPTAIIGGTLGSAYSFGIYKYQIAPIFHITGGTAGYAGTINLYWSLNARM